MVFGKSYKEQIAPLYIVDSPIDFVQEWKYLGTTIVSGKVFTFTARPDLTSFFRATNAVINVLTGAHEHTLLTLLYSNCVPILTYACAVKQYSASEMCDCNLAMNNVFRKIFGFKDWRSIRTLREVFGFKSLYEVFKTAQEKFLSLCTSHQNPIVGFIATLINSR